MTPCVEIGRDHSWTYEAVPHSHETDFKRRRAEKIIGKLAQLLSRAKTFALRAAASKHVKARSFGSDRTILTATAISQGPEVPMLAALLTAIGIASSAPAPRFLAITGATVSGLPDQNAGARDLPNATILIRGDRIVAVWSGRRRSLPRRTVVVDGRGLFAVPGLIDGFGALRSQRFADAYLYEGVTTVIVPLAPKDGGEGEDMLIQPRSGPDVITAAPVGGYSPAGGTPAPGEWARRHSAKARLSVGALRRRVEAEAASGHKVVWAGLDLWPDQLAEVVRAAHRFDMPVVAQLAFSTYSDGVRSGVDVFARNDRYTVAFARSGDLPAYAADPMGPGARVAMTRVCAPDEVRAEEQAFGRELSRSSSWLMPALSMEATADDLDGLNPWRRRSAAIVTPSDIDDAVDPKTGTRPYLAAHPERAPAIQRCARAKADADRQLHLAGARYVAGSSTPGYGVLPGGGLHDEIRHLQEIGLTPCEALAAATSGAARAFRLRDRGRIAPGRVADLLLVEKDPKTSADAVDHIATVMFHGRVVDRERLIRSATGKTRLSDLATFTG